MANQTALGVSTNNILTPGYPISGGDAPGTNLTLRSTSHPNKGTVIIDEYTASFGSNTGALQTLGGIGAQHNVSAGGAFYNMPYGYSLGNIIAPLNFSGFYPGYSQIVTITATSTTSGIATLTFAAQTIPPFWAGQTLIVQNVAPATYNGTFTVLTCTTTTVTVANSNSSGSLTTIGWAYTNAFAGATTPNIIISAPPLAGGQTASSNAIMNTINVVAVSSTGSNTVTITFQPTFAIPPFTPGQLVDINGVAPASYNGLWPVTACTGSSVTVVTSAATGAITVQGTISSGNVMSNVITNPGTGYTLPPTVVYQDPTPAVSQFYQASLQVTAGTYVKAPQTPTTPSTQIHYYYVLGQGLSTVQITGTAGQFSCSAATLTVGATVTVFGTLSSGSITGFNNYATYYIIATNGTTTFTLSATSTGLGLTTTTSAALTGVYFYVSTGGVMSGTAPTTNTTGWFTNGTATLTYVGTVAQGYSALGYSGIITQGAIHQMGCLVSGVIVAQGSGYTSPPIVTFSRPDMLGGRYPQAAVTVSGGAITNFTIEDQGSGYLYPPTITLTNVGTGTGTGAIITAVIGNPGEKPIVSTMPTQYNNVYYIDFGLAGNNVVFITGTATTATIYFDNITGNAPYNKGFPQGRRVIVYYKNNNGSTCTVTFTNLQAANTNTGSNAPTVSTQRTAKFEFIVLTTDSTQNPNTSSPGGTANDVYCTITAA